MPRFRIRLGRASQGFHRRAPCPVHHSGFLGAHSPLLHLFSLTARLPHLDEIIGFIDQPAQGSKPFDVGSIEITGWAASKLGIENIEIDCDGTLLGIAFFGVLRPEIAIAFPDFKDAGRSGFFWMLDATRQAAGRHVVRVVARSHSGQWKEWTRDFILGSTT